MLQLKRISQSLYFKPAEYHLLNNGAYLGKIILTKKNTGTLELNNKLFTIMRTRWRIVEIVSMLNSNSAEKMVFEATRLGLSNRGQVQINNQIYYLKSKTFPYRLVWTDQTGRELIKFIPAPVSAILYAPLFIFAPIFYFPPEFDITSLDDAFTNSEPGHILYLLSAFLLSLKYK